MPPTLGLHVFNGPCRLLGAKKENSPKRTQTPVVRHAGLLSPELNTHGPRAHPTDAVTRWGHTGLCDGLINCLHGHIDCKGAYEPVSLKAVTADVGSGDVWRPAARHC